MDVDEPLTKEWIIRTGFPDANSYSAVPTTLRSMSQTHSMMVKTNKLLRSLNTASAMKAINQGGMRQSGSINIIDDLEANRKDFANMRHSSA